MTSNDILQYLRETPHNTNVNVVKGMIGNESGSGSGTIEMTTLFEDDISLSYYTGGQFSSAYAMYTTTTIDFSAITTGIIKITFENVIMYAILYGDRNFYYGTDVSNPELPFIKVNGGYDPPTNRLSFYFESDSEQASDAPDLQVYCQTPHHLKIELFII